MTDHAPAPGRLGVQVDLAVLALIFLLHLAVNIIWGSMHELRIGDVTDDHAHMVGFQHLATSISLGGVGAAFHYLREMNSHYSYLAHYPLALAAQLVGDKNMAVVVGNAAYFALLLLAVYRLGRACHSRGAGLLSAALVALMPATSAGWKWVGLDYPGMCLTALAMVPLFEGRGLRSPRRAALFGVLAGAAILARPQAALFLMWPPAAQLGVGLWQDLRAGRRGQVLGLALAACLSILAVLAVTSLWWWGRLDDLMKLSGAHATGEGMLAFEGDTSLAGGIRFHLEELPTLLSGPMALALLPVGYLFVRAGRRRAILLAWLLVPLLVHMASPLRHYRYLLLLAPAAAVLLGVGLFSLRPRLRAVASGALILPTLALYIACSFSAVRCPLTGQGPLVRSLQWVLDLNMRLPAGMVRCGQPLHISPACEDVRNEEDHRNHILRNRLSGWLSSRLGDGRRGVIYTSIATQSWALAIQQRLPRTLYSVFDWSPRRHYPVPEEDRRFVLMMKDGALPELHGRKPLILPVNEPTLEHGMVRKTMVMWQLRPGEKRPRRIDGVDVSTEPLDPREEG